MGKAETMMKALSKILFAATAVAVLAIQPAAAATVCLNVKSIKSSDISKDGSAVTIAMRDGKLWHSQFEGKCPDLQFTGGFAWTVRADQVCDNEPTVRVIESGQICRLGKFTPG